MFSENREGRITIRSAVLKAFYVSNHLDEKCSATPGPNNYF